MTTMIVRCAMVDVHKAMVMTTVRVPGANGERQAHTQRFDTTTAGLLALRDWLESWRVTLTHLKTIPGVKRRTAEIVIAETGADMSRFPTAAHLVSWAAMCPGQHESAGKRRSGRTRNGNAYLRTALIEAAGAAARTNARRCRRAIVGSKPGAGIRRRSWPSLISCSPSPTT